MRLNTPQQVANGRRLLKDYGSWQRLRECSDYDHARGVLVVARQPAHAASPTLDGYEADAIGEVNQAPSPPEKA